jgi:hypothetical protein
MPTQSTRHPIPGPVTTSDAAAIERELHRCLSSQVVDEIRETTGYNPRQRLATAHRLLLVVIEVFLLGETLSFAAIRAAFIKRFGFIRPCPLQKRFKQPEAALFFRVVFMQLVDCVLEHVGVRLTGPLAAFSDVRVYDCTSQRVPPRGRSSLPACVPGRAGTKWLIGYSLRTGLLDDGLCDAATASELPLYRTLVTRFERGALYLLDLGFFERRLFADLRDAGAHLLMRLKSGTKVRIVAHLTCKGMRPVEGCGLAEYLASHYSPKATLFDLDVLWGQGRKQLPLRLVGVALSGSMRWYLTTVPRSTLGAADVVQTYRLRWAIELLFRELKQSADLGRSFTADPNAIEAMSFGALIAHVLVRSVRLQAALASEIPLERLRPLAALRMVRSYTRELVDALASGSRARWSSVVDRLIVDLVPFAFELEPSRSRPRIPLQLGAVGA